MGCEFVWLGKELVVSLTVRLVGYWLSRCAAL